MSDWLNERFVSLPFIYLFIFFKSVVEIRSCTGWMSHISVLLLLCGPGKGLKLKMESVSVG